MLYILYIKTHVRKFEVKRKFKIICLIFDDLDSWTHSTLILSPEGNLLELLVDLGCMGL